MPYGLLQDEPYISFIRKLQKHKRVIYKVFHSNQIEEDKIVFKKTPWEEQQKVIDTFLRKKRYCGMIQAPTGSGKTNMFLFLLGKINKRALIIVPTSDLVEQTYKRITDVLFVDKSKVGRYYSKKKELKEITISTWQSLYKQEAFQKILDFRFNVIIADEAHRASADKYGWILSSYPAIYKIGVTATPFHTKKDNTDKMKLLLGPIIYKVDIEKLYQAGNLVRPNVAFVNTGVTISIEEIFIQRYLDDMSKNEKFERLVRYKLKKDGVGEEIKQMSKYEIASYYFSLDDFAYKYASSIDQDTYPRIEQIDKKTSNQALGILKSGIDNNYHRRRNILQYIVDTIKEAGKSLILLNTVENCTVYQNELKNHGINAEVITGKTKNKKDLLQWFDSAEDAVAIGTTSLLGEGLDIPSLKNLYVCSPVFPPFTDLARVAQVPGRAVRSYEGKTEANIIYFEDNSYFETNDKSI